jgi:hypothetical protein
MKALVSILVAFIAASELPAQTFTNVTAGSGLDAVRQLRDTSWWVSGLQLVDLDNDGDLDLFLSSHDGKALAALNDGTGHFTAASSGYPSSEIHIPYDINEDGKLDFSMTYNDGGGQWWTNSSTSGALNFIASGMTRGSARQQAMVDINKDGNVDWLIGVERSGIEMDYGNGTGGFASGSKSISLSSFVNVDGITSVPVDIDNDGDKDLIVEWGRYEYENGRTRVYRNDGGGNFTDVTAEAGLYQDNLAVLSVGDADHDGDVDLVAMENKQAPLSVFLNDGTGHFTKKAGALSGAPSGGFSEASWGLGCLTDFDNDGQADLIIGGRTYLHMYRGTGNANFTYMNTAWNIVNTAEASVDHAFSFGDIDNDGDLDILGWKQVWPNRYYNLYRNDLPAKNWVRVRPVGLAGNRGAAGAKIRIYKPGTDSLLWFEEVVTYCKQSAQGYGYAYAQTERHYGLGSRATCDVEVQFYPSGAKVRKNGVAAKTTAVISEGPSSVRHTGFNNGATARPFKTRQAIQLWMKDGAQQTAQPKNLIFYSPDGRLVTGFRSSAEGRKNHQIAGDSRHMPTGAYIAKLHHDGE